MQKAIGFMQNVILLRFMLIAYSLMHIAFGYIKNFPLMELL